jgi:putative ABC transport system ATP-binding protein
MPLVKAQHLEKQYVAGDITVNAIRGIDFSIEPASFVSFVGPSGSGKSTLLNMSASFRGEHIGFIFQDFNLIPVLTVFENIEYPLQMVQNWPVNKRKERVEEMLEAVDMKDQANKFPGQISGGQKQRVAVARALVTNAKLVLADEPTANLDRETALRIISLMKEMRDNFGTTFIFSTHDPKVVENAETVFTLEDGSLIQQANN